MAARKSTRGDEQPMTSAVFPGAEAVKDGFEKIVQTCDQLMAFGKDNAEAMFKSANAAGKGLETINSEVFAFTRTTMAEGIAATKAVLSARSFEELFHLQGEFGKALFQSQVDEGAKFSQVAISTVREAAEPIQARVAAAVESLQAR
jgi:phasin family protein